MEIKSVTIKNIRGFQNTRIELDMIPNKPSIIVAPNGSGKTSFAVAFNSVKPRSFIVDNEEIYSNNDTFIPELIVETDTRTYNVNPNFNELTREFSVYVINNQNKVKTITNNIGGRPVATSRMHVPPIILVKNFPEEVVINNTFKIDNNLNHFARGIIPSIDSLLNNNIFLNSLDISVIRPLVRPMRLINEFISRLQTYEGTKTEVWERIRRDDIQTLQQIGMVSNIAGQCQAFVQNQDIVCVYLVSIQLIALYLKQQELFKAKINRANYLIERKSYKDLFSSLKTTWKNIKPKEVNHDLVIEINDSNKLSNGERDIIVFLAMLQQAKNTLVKPNNILIIDEIFDYLDDANLVAAQYYITGFIDEIKAKGYNIFPIILSHLNPNYFKTFAFRDLKVYYLNRHRPMYSSKMEKLLLRRSELMKEDKQNGTTKDLISKYMLHFYNDYSFDMGETFNNKPELNPWKDINVFKNYCKSETNKYINNTAYDSIAVCIWLRECIEKYIYDNLPADKKNELFIKHGTKKKIEFAEESGVSCHEIFSLLGLIYNDNLHTDNKSNIDSRETLYSRLENNTIRSMIRFVTDKYPA